jgi:hypothetical protein
MSDNTFISTDAARALIGLPADAFEALATGPFTPSVGGRMHLRSAFGVRLAAHDLGFLPAGDAVRAALTASADARADGNRLFAVFYRGHEAVGCWLAAGVDTDLRIPAVIVPADRLYREFTEAAAAATSPPSWKMH